MIWNPEYECMDRAALHQLQLRRLQMTTSWAYERVPHYRAQHGGARRAPARHPRARRRAPPAVHRRERAARHLPLRHVRPAARRGRARALLVGHDRQAGRRRLLARRHQHLDRADRPGRRRRRRAARRPRPDGLPLRHVDRRLGPALRHRAHRRDDHPRRRRADRAPPRHDARLRHHGARLDAVLRALPRRAGRGARRRLRDAQAPARPLRRRAVLRPHEGRDRGAARHPRHRQLRPLRGHGPRRRRRVRLRLRPARQRGPSAARDRRPGERRAARRTARRASSSSRRSPRRPSRSCATAPTTSRRSTRRAASAGARWRA